MSQRDMVQHSVDRDKQRDVTPLRPPGDRRQRHRNEGEDACLYCGAPIVDDELLRMACPALLGQPLPTHARPGMRVKVGDGGVDPAQIVEWLRGRTGAHGGGFTSADDVADAIEREFVR